MKAAKILPASSADGRLAGKPARAAVGTRASRRLLARLLGARRCFSTRPGRQAGENPSASGRNDRPGFVALPGAAGSVLVRLASHQQVKDSPGGPRKTDPGILSEVEQARTAPGKQVRMAPAWRVVGGGGNPRPPKAGMQILHPPARPHLAENSSRAIDFATGRLWTTPTRDLHAADPELAIWPAGRAPDLVERLLSQLPNLKPKSAPAADPRQPGSATSRAQPGSWSWPGTWPRRTDRAT
jgi:hypothetical protein